MRKRSWAILAVLVAAVAVGGGVGALYLYDSSRDNLIAKGVTIAGTDVGGMTADEARAAVERQVAAKTARPLTIRYESRGFVVPAERLGVSVDVASKVEEALGRSRAGNFVTRAVRDLTGGEVDSALRVPVSYSGAAVDRLVSRLQREINVQPKDARASISVTAVNMSPSRTGIRLKAPLLRTRIGRELRRLNGDRRVDAPTQTLTPKTTTRELKSRYAHFITISRSEKRLRFFVNFRLAKTYSIAVGRAGFETPSGLHRVYSKAVNPAWYAPEWAGEYAGKIIPGNSPENPIKARWMEFSDGAGIHGTDAISSIGTSASHGCIRMLIPQVIELYERVPLGTPVYVV
ncbi:MAG TPA: L,D-transpeptidase/peptidoglycan binding protein [Gaiellaceae bacterium]|nr:L,D-transpeptidase/peptidoglycan binding protein [Gaiellaceae bacterium]